MVTEVLDNVLFVKGRGNTTHTHPWRKGKDRGETDMILLCVPGWMPDLAQLEVAVAKAKGQGEDEEGEGMR